MVSTATLAAVERNGGTKAELDSHADTCTFGSEALVVQDTGATISVSGFVGSLGTLKNIPIVTAAVAYDDPDDFKTYVLFFHQALYVKSMNRHLLCPSQIRHNQVIVNDTPLQYIPQEERKPEHHSIVTPLPKALKIPLQMAGTTSYFKTRKPTWDEVKE